MPSSCVYGHSEAGSHWQNHLETQLRAKELLAYQNTQACVYLSHIQWVGIVLSLIVHVDDMLLAGDTCSHDHAMGLE